VTRTPIPTGTVWPCDTELLDNGGFEDWFEHGSGGPPDGWALSTTGLTAVQETTLVFDGWFSVRGTLNFLITQGTMTQPIPAPVNSAATYRLSLWALDTNTNGDVRANVAWLDDSMQLIRYGIGTAASDNLPVWQNLTGSEVPPNNAAWALMMIEFHNTFAGSTVHVDNASFIEECPMTPTPTPVLTPTYTPGPTLPPTPTPYPTATLTPEPSATPGFCVHSGDVNDDSAITPGDAQLTFQFYMDCAGMAPSLAQYCAADYCGSGAINPCDGSVTPGDAQAILRVYLGIADPCG